MRMKPWIPIKTLCAEAKKSLSLCLPFLLLETFLRDPDVRYRGHEAVGCGSHHLPGQVFH